MQESLGLIPLPSVDITSQVVLLQGRLPNYRGRYVPANMKRGGAVTVVMTITFLTQRATMVL